MEGKCPACGISVSSNHKFCPACGAPLAASSEPEKQNEEKERRLVLRKGRYGDTEMYDHSVGKEDHSSRKPKKIVKAKKKAPDNSTEPAGAANVSLYLSLAALVISVAAIAMVLIFAVFPSANNAPSDTAASDMAEQTEAPTDAPTEPPIAGTYKVSEWNGDDSNIATKMLKTATLKMESDYTGKVTVGSLELGDVSLEKGSDQAYFIDADCTYSFDGNNLTIDYKGMTLLFKKQ